MTESENGEPKVSDSASCRMRVDSEGRRVLDVEIDGNVHTHIMKPGMPMCEICAKDDNLARIFKTILARVRAGG